MIIIDTIWTGDIKRHMGWRWMTNDGGGWYRTVHWGFLVVLDTNCVHFGYYYN